jgi:hypothetical protein
MSDLLSGPAAAFAICTPFMLLTCRFFWPTRVRWWMVVVLTGCASWLLCELQLHFKERALLDAQEKCLAAAAVDPPPGRDCPLPLADYRDLPTYERWVPGIVWLVLLLPAYGVANFVRRRRGALPPNTSLERTREG